MKKNILLIASGSFMALHGVSAVAQETQTEATVETETKTGDPTAMGEGAVVTRETTTTTTTADTGEVSTDTAATQTVETPAGNATVVARIKDEDGKTKTTVDHSKMDHSGHDMDDSEESDPEPEAN